jgi:hypothetical protein
MVDLKHRIQRPDEHLVKYAMSEAPLPLEADPTVSIRADVSAPEPTTTVASRAAPS